MRTSFVIRGLLLAALACAVLAGAAGAGASARPAERSYSTLIRGDYVPGQVIVGYRANTSRADLARVHGRVPARVTERFSNLRIDVVKLAPGLSVSQAVRRYERDPSVAFAEPDYLRSPQADLFSDLWGLDNTGQLHAVADSVEAHPEADHAGTFDADIDAPEAWAAATVTTTHPIVAVIDNGVDVNHPDLSGQLWQNPKETCLACLPTVDDDDNNKVDDINGWDFANNDASLLDTGAHFPVYEHGTHVSGTIAGNDNDDGIVGVCPQCRIMVLKIARDSDGRFLLSAEVAALSYAKKHEATIANMSFGGPDWSNAERNAIANSGLLVVVSAGNEALDNDMYLYADRDEDGNVDARSPSFPASFTLSNILAVGASNDQDENAYSTECFAVNASRPDCAFTNWGHDSVDLAAPGVDVESSIPGNTWETWDGTSMAAPHVAGTAGLVLSQHPSYTTSQLKNALMRSVDKPDPNTLRTIYIPWYVDQTGHSRTKTGAFSRTTGRINAFSALTAGTSSATPLTDGNINGAKSFSGASVRGSVSWPADVNDVKKKKLYKGHLYRVTLGVPAGKDYDLFIWKPGAKELWQNAKFAKASRRIGAGDEVIQFIPGSTGTYYFQTMAWLFKSGSYKLTVQKLA
jgi:subtilisin family serine protease